MADGAASNLTNTLGSAYIGAMIMMILYGITCLQTFMVFIRYPRDSLTTKWLVIILWVMESLHVALVSHAMYHYLISSFANPAALEYGIWSLYLSIGVNVSIAFVVQCFFIHKIHGLSGRNWYLTGPLSIVVLLHLAFGFETMAEFFIKKRLNSLAQLTYIAALPFAVAAVLSDIAIVVALCLLLQHNKTSFRSTNVLLNYLIVYAINRCLLTSIVAISEVVVFATIPNSFWYLAIDFVVGKCYANSLLATLNSRSALRGKGFDNERNPDESSSDGVRFTSIEIAGVTPSMLPHSRAVTQNERVSLNSEASRSRTDVGLVELKDVKARTRDTSHLSAISMREESSSVNIEGDTLEYREP